MQEREESSARTVADEIKATKATEGSSTERVRRHRAKKREKGVARAARAAREPEDDKAPYAPNAESIALSAILGNTVWNLSRMFTKHTALSAEQQQELGAALDPLLYKYLPSLDGWKEELAFVMVVWGVWNATEPPKPEGTNDGAIGASVDGPGAPAREQSSAVVLD